LHCNNNSTLNPLNEALSCQKCITDKVLPYFCQQKARSFGRC
jgi:hypothetical protein